MGKAKKKLESPVLRAFMLLRQAITKRTSNRDANRWYGDLLELVLKSGFRFEGGEWEAFHTDFYGTYWACDQEHWYTVACKAGNPSACRSLEAFLDRPPLILGGKRLHVGADVKWEGKACEVTGFGQDVRGWYVRVARFEYPVGKGGQGRKAVKRYSLTLADLKSRIVKPPPATEPLLKKVVKYFDGYFPRDAAKKYKTFEEAWTSPPADRYAPYWMFSLLVQLKWPMTYIEGENLKRETAGEVRAFVGDFKVLHACLTAEAAKREKDARQKKKAQTEERDG